MDILMSLLDKLGKFIVAIIIAVVLFLVHG